MRGLATVLPVVLALLVLTGVGRGDSYYPLDVGGEWHYANDNGQDEDTVITGYRDLLGVTTTIRHEEIYNTRIPPQVVENFWTSDGEGNLLLHGAVNYTDTLAMAYWPPIVMIDAPLWAGKSWVTENIHVYELDGTPTGMEPFNYPLAVHFVGEIIVPAGTFQCFGVGFDAWTPILRLNSGRAYDIYGRRVRVEGVPGSRDATEWYSEGVGLIQYSYLTDPGEMMKLTWWQPTPVARGSWGSIKARFR
jgi:hypothetical protein